MLIEAHAIGWMHDFGEYVPLVAKYKNWSSNSNTYHNAYPLQWAQLCAEAIQTANTDHQNLYEDTVTFMRAGSTHSP